MSVPRNPGDAQVTTALAIPEPDRAALTAEAEDTRAGLAVLRDLPLTTQAEYEEHGAWLLEAQARVKAIEERRTTITKPMLAAKQAVDDFFREASEPYAAVVAVIKQKVGAFELATKAAQVQAAQDVAAGVPGAELVVPVAPVRGVSVKEVWKWRVHDGAKVPREFLCIDERALDGHVRAAGDAAPGPIAGVVFYKDTQVRATPPRKGK